MKNEVFAKIKTWIGVLLMDYTFALVRLSGRSKIGSILCRCHRKLLSLLNISFLPVESAHSYNEKYKICDIVPIRQNRVGYVTDTTFEIEKVDTVLEERSLPDLNYYHFKNVLIQGDSDMVIDKHHGCVINDFCYNLDENVKFVDGLLYQLKSNWCILRSNMNSVARHIPSGIMINGKFSKNYYHEILENLIKLVYIDELNIPDDVPIIVDSNVKKVSAFDFIFSQLTSRQHRKVLFIDKDEMWQVDDLYAISYVNRITPHIIGRSITKEDIIFDIESLKCFRNQLLPFKSGKEFPKRVFLTRKKTTHRNFNEADILKLIEPLGFEPIAPEELSFQDQLAMFNQADFIIGGTGAAFTNLLFAKESTKIVCVRPNVEGSPSVFTVLARMNACRLLYYRSDELRKSSNIHSDYYVAPQRFSDCLNNYIGYEGHLK